MILPMFHETFRGKACHTAPRSLRAITMANGFRRSDNVCQPDRALAAAAGDVHRIAEHRSGVDHCSGRLGVLMLFNLIILPAEFDASARARLVLRETGLIQTQEENTAVAQVLRAAAWTYVAAFITFLTYFLLHLLPLVGGRSG